LGSCRDDFHKGGPLPMSLHPAAIEAIPDDTARVARAAFPRGNPYMRLRNKLGSLFIDPTFASLFATRGKPAESPARLAMVCVMQFVEGLHDRQAADAVRARIDWKYILGLELDDAGFDFSVLSKFRARLVEDNAERMLLDVLLQRLLKEGIIKARGRQRSDSTHVFAAVRTLNRLERVGETLRATLNALATVAPEWLAAQVPVEWYERYERRVENYHLPKTDAARQELARTIGIDGQRLLHMVDTATEEFSWLSKILSAQILRTIWAEQYVEQDGQIRWLDNKEVAEIVSPANAIASPYDPDARYSSKRGMGWVGYKAHFTETCDDNAPRMITNVETTPATTPDDNMLAPIHASLEERKLLPHEHLVDKGYTDSGVFVESPRKYDVTIVGPVADDPSWQARAKNGLDKSCFPVDWDQRIVTCPEGKKSISFLPSTYQKNGMAFEASFARKDCTPCQSRSLCTRSRTEPRTIGLQPREQYEALQDARRRQCTKEFQEQYAARAGVEATHAQALRRCDLRQARYVGLPKTSLQHVLTAVAVNVVRLTEWWAGTPLARTRISRFSAL
jgi:transposase